MTPATQYSELMQAAASRTLSLGLPAPDLPWTAKPLLPRPFAPTLALLVMKGLGDEVALARITRGDLRFTSYLIQLLARVSPVLQLQFGVPVTVTFGSMGRGIESWAELRDEDAIAYATEWRTAPSVTRMHAWLTLPSSEVIDLLPPWPRAGLGEGWLHGHADCLPKDHWYRPSTVGLDFLTAGMPADFLEWYDRYLSTRAAGPALQKAAPTLQGGDP